MSIKIYGYGYVGKVLHSLFPDAFLHDPAQGKFYKEKTDVSFIAVPTPLKDGKLDTSIVEEVIKGCDSPIIIIRSTMMPGTCDKFPDKNIVFQPEYLGEGVAHPLLNEAKTPFMILGGTPENRRKVIELYQQVYNSNITIRQVTNYEAEVIKLSENRAIAFKVAQIQELYDACEAAKVDFYTVRDAVYGDDPRFNLWWTFVYPKKRGFRSSCIPKDIYGWAAWAESCGYKPELTIKLLEVNETLLRNSSL